MPLDPQLIPILEASAAAATDLPPVWEQTVEQRRKTYLALADVAGPGPDLPSVEDIVVAGVRCRVYTPNDAHGLIIYFHGGGFAIGDLETHDEPCRRVAFDVGATLVAVDYRLAPEHPFPAGVDDAWSVVQALHARRDEFGDGGRVVLVGDSAGGNLAAVSALMARTAGLDLAAQVLVYPTVDLLDDSPSMTENGEGPVLTQDIWDWFMHHYQADGADWRASPARAASLAGLPPTTVITAEFDMMRDQGIAYAERLRCAGVEVHHTNYEGMVHAFFQLGPLVDAARQAVTEVTNACRAALH